MNVKILQWNTWFKERCLDLFDQISQKLQLKISDIMRSWDANWL
jgi:hypothetical protein